MYRGGKLADLYGTNWEENRPIKDDENKSTGY